MTNEDRMPGSDRIYYAAHSAFLFAAAAFFVAAAYVAGEGDTLRIGFCICCVATTLLPAAIIAKIAIIGIVPR